MPTTVDIHTHFYPRTYIDRLKQRQVVPRVLERDGIESFMIFPVEEHDPRGDDAQGRPLDRSYYDIDHKLAWMDQHEIVHSVISLGNPWFDFLPVEEASAFATRTNAAFADIVSRHPTRLSWYAALPAQDLAAALTELERVAAVGARAIVISTRPGGRSLDETHLWPLYERLQDLGVPLLIHPHYALGGEDLSGYDHGLPLVFGFPFETSVAAARLILSGIVDAFPRLKVILAHLGGTLPYLAGRLDAWHASIGGGRLPVPPSRYLNRLYYDALGYHPAAIRCALQLVGPRRILFGSDHPFAIEDIDAVRESLEAQDLAPEDLQRIDHANAMDLFGL